MLGLAVTLVPFDQRVADPPPGGAPDDRVGDAVRQWISTTRRACLEHRTRDVPLQEMDATPDAGREVHELMNEQALARAREPGEEDQAPVGQSVDALREPAIGVHDDARSRGVAHARRWLSRRSPATRTAGPAGTGRPDPFRKARRRTRRR